MGRKNAENLDTAVIYQSVLSHFPEVAVKGAQNKYTSLNGNMYSFRSSTGEMAFRLPDDQRTAFLEKHPDGLCIQYETVMKHYVQIPNSILGDEVHLVKLFADCLAHAQTLKAKPTKRKTAAKKKVSKPRVSTPKVSKPKATKKTTPAVPKRALRKKK